MIINGSSNYWGATSGGPVRALAVFIIYEAGLQLQPSKAFNWLISSSATEKHKSNTISDPSRGILSDKPTQSASTKIPFYQPARQDIWHFMHLNLKKGSFFKNIKAAASKKLLIWWKHFKHILIAFPLQAYILLWIHTMSWCKFY